MRFTAFLILFFFIFAQISFAEDAPQTSTNTTAGSSEIESNLPPWTRDLRRTEIITLGSLPFVTIWTTIAYSLAVYGQMTNPLDKSSSNFTEGDQWRIIGISLGACTVLGITDLAISLMNRHSREMRERNAYREIKVIPLIPEVDKDYNYLEIEGVESAVF